MKKILLFFFTAVTILFTLTACDETDTHSEVTDGGVDYGVKASGLWQSVRGSYSVTFGSDGVSHLYGSSISGQIQGRFNYDQDKNIVSLSNSQNKLSFKFIHKDTIQAVVDKDNNLALYSIVQDGMKYYKR